MFNQNALLENEFFPAELPPCFSTAEFAAKGDDAIQAAKAFNRDFSIPLIFSGYKSEAARRRFALPNPYHYCLAVDFVVNHEVDIKAILKKSSYSLTAPIDKPLKRSQPYAKRTSTVSETKSEIEKLYQDNRYEIRLDISSFFDSIYTHAIPWAAHGIEISKKRKNDKTLWGNTLDKCIEAMNYKQTNGILVGNAISRIVSEIILCTVDEQIQKKFPRLVCCRFVDDYYIYTKDSSQIQEIIATVRTALAQYQLSFNENKLQINESPFTYGKPWIDHMRQYIYLSPEMYLSRLIAEYNTRKDITIFKYGLKVIASCYFNEKSWPVMQSRLLNLWVRFPSLADRILPILWQNKSIIKKDALKNAVYSVIDQSLLLGHAQELIWAVWYIRTFELKISQPYIIRVLKSENDLAIIIMLDIIEHIGAKNKRDVEKQCHEIRAMLEETDSPYPGKSGELMWSEHWLLSYEADRMKWLNFSGDLFGYARKNQFFKTLLINHVRFYNESFSYDAPNAPVRGRYDLVTRADLNRALLQLKKTILSRLKNSHGEEDTNLTPEENHMYEEFTQMLDDSESDSYSPVFWWF